jgi:hypothetical protein
MENDKIDARKWLVPELKPDHLYLGRRRSPAKLGGMAFLKSMIVDGLMNRWIKVRDWENIYWLKIHLIIRLQNGDFTTFTKLN